MRGSWWTARSPAGRRGPFPFGTLTVNISGAALLGFLGGLALSQHAALLAGTAFVGAYTTFSTWMLETQRLSEERRSWAAVANIVVSVALGLAAALLGQWIAEPAMNEPCLKLTTYFGERQRAPATSPVPGRRDAGSVRRQRTSRPA